jgi:single-strand DNA-binding protein
MASLNKVQLIGRLGRDPETRFTPRGTKVTNFSVAVGRRWRDSDGQVQEDTDWFNIVAWGRLAEICQEYLTKGRLVYIEGRLKTDRYEVDGETRYSTKVVARNMQMLERKPEEPEPDPPEEEEGEE